MPLILGTNSIKDEGYVVDNSLRFDDGSSDSLTRTLSSSNRKTYTISTWVKRSELGIVQNIFTSGVNGVGDSGLRFLSGNNISFYEILSPYSSYDFSLETDAVFRDVSAWYHIVISVDTTQATNSNRIKIYVNNSQITSFSSVAYPSQDFQGFINHDFSHQVSGAVDITFGNRYFNGYQAEFVFIDGQQLDPTSFGEFDSDSPTIWKPIDVSGLTFGTNGFYLDFENSGSLGADVSGNGNNFTVNNLTSIDQSTDTCTNNFATLNGVAIGLDATLSEGNLKMASGTATTRSGTASTIGLSQGKWFAEFKITQSANGIVGIAGTTQNRSSTDDDDIGNYPGRTQQGYGYLSGGDVYNDSSAVSGSFASFTTNDIIGVAVDLDNNLLYFYKNGTVQNSGTGIDISGITTQSGNWFFAVGDGSGSTASTVECNFGSPPYAISSGNSDGNGYGNFEYAVPSGYYALNTKNLAEYG
jgi:hypothetical protein